MLATSWEPGRMFSPAGRRERKQEHASGTWAEARETEASAAITTVERLTRRRRSRVIVLE